MCEFCTKHGEGKKWYLQMKNYSQVLLHEELSSPQREIAGTTTRLEWLNNYFEEWIVPAIRGAPQAGEESEPAPPAAGSAGAELSEDESMERRKLTQFAQVLPIEDVERVVDVVDSITRMPCGCRFISTGQTDKRYCFGIGVDRWGVLGRFPDAASSLEVLDKEEAKGMLRGYDDEGLAHTVWTALTPYVYTICNCDHDCRPYKRYIEQGGAPAFFRAEYLCQIDWDLCTGCKACMSQCQFGAQFYSSALARVYIDPTRCFGCGVCRAVCPHDAIQTMPRQEHPEAENLWLDKGP